MSLESQENDAASGHAKPASMAQDVGSPSEIDQAPALLDVSEVQETDESHQVKALCLSFTGQGSEYFRIWIVNLCLSVLSLGIYSAWAKVRRLQYFDRNTQLERIAFDFHGSAWTILRGRLIAVVMVFAYNYLFGISLQFAIPIVLIFLLLGPLMMRSSLRFRLRQTSYRGLRFDFQAPTLTTYAVYFPLVLLFLLPPLMLMMYPDAYWPMLSFLLYLAWPWLHARMKAFQFNYFGYANLSAKSDLNSGEFVGNYFAAMALLIVAAIGLALFVISVFAVQKSMDITGDWAMVVPFLGMMVFYLIFYWLLGPMIQTKVANASWNSCRLGGIEFHSEMDDGAYSKLQIKNLLLTMMTLGFYRPFAVVNTYRYRIHTMRIMASSAQLLALSEGVRSENTVGDASADLFGLDLSW